MTNKGNAFEAAATLSRIRSAPRFVIYSPGEEDTPGNDYHVATAADLDTHFGGCEILASFEYGRLQD